MIEIRGTCFDGKSSKAHNATLRYYGGPLTIKGEDGLFECTALLSQCSLDPPLGKTTRILRLPGGTVFETADDEAMDTLEKSAGKSRVMRFVHGIESRWKTVAITFGGIILFIWLFHTYAIPHLARRIAFSLPPHITEEVSRQTMGVLDKHLFEPSDLPAERADMIRKDFHALVHDMGPDRFTYRLEFRKSPAIGPNAFALPSGTIVMTDELVKLSENERELEGILLHEIGHVKERHALRMVIQNAGIFLVIAALSGDLSEISSTAASLPTVLAHSGYSRAFEREADRFAALYFLRKGWSIKAMQDILRRISKDAPKFPGESVLSTHPVIEERLGYLESLGRNQNR